MRSSHPSSTSFRTLACPPLPFAALRYPRLNSAALRYPPRCASLRYADQLIHRQLAAAIGWESAPPELSDAAKTTELARTLNERHQASPTARPHSLLSTACFPQRFPSALSTTCVPQPRPTSFHIPLHP